MRRISTRRGLAVWDYRSVLAHELGHATYGDVASDCGRTNSKQERRADLFAAELLIDPQQLSDLALWHRHDFRSLAADLEVTPSLLKLYIEHHDISLKETVP
ncbi:ImmA/IrrE family metallo-endopeptidase [Corynebacterium ciconiae]|uniref:ImmA/IrrE family metallo-endopeptidase n=1 Tax=Corynebacterium ciconiae TaxID=227319 RepID=UPI001AD83F4C|nr:ImmA/IrrE family metallo-endopeptidase [Corynebacterium ciconiae]